jgi:hypothetical protein
MILENVDVAKKTFTLKFSDEDIAHMSFGADKYGFTEMRVEVSKKDEDGKFMEGFMISYHWDAKKDEAPAFVMDMMSMLHKLGKIGADAGENTDTVAEDAPVPSVGEEEEAEEVAEEEEAEEATEEEEVKEEDPEGD